MGHLLGYARVSTTDQQPHLQVDALERAGCYRVFTETASGARSDRPTLTQVLDQLRPGDTLVVWKLDRLGRSLRHLVDTVTRLAERGVGFRSLQEAIDTTTPGGKLVFHVFAALAEFERDLIRERTSAGLAAARARGRQGGRPSVLTAHKLQVAQVMHGSGQYTVAAIAKTLGVSRASIYRHLTNPTGDTGPYSGIPRGREGQRGQIVGVDLSLTGPLQQPGRALGPVRRCHGGQPRCTGWPRWSATDAAPPDGGPRTGRLGSPACTCERRVATSLRSRSSSARSSAERLRISDMADTVLVCMSRLPGVPGSPADLLGSGIT
jgi:DNA invertase Pin-like site-specific DNA recombinase